MKFLNTNTHLAIFMLFVIKNKLLVLFIFVLYSCSTKQNECLELYKIKNIEKEFADFHFYKRGSIFFTYPQLSPKVSTTYFWSGYGDTIKVYRLIVYEDSSKANVAEVDFKILDSIKLKSKYIFQYNLLGSTKENVHQGINQIFYFHKTKILIVRDATQVTNKEWLHYLNSTNRLDENTYCGSW